MTANEFTKLWNMLEGAYPTSQAVKNKYSRRVWEQALGPYELEAITKKVLAYIRENKYFPDVADITAGIYYEGKENAGKDYGWMKKYCKDQEAKKDDSWMNEYA